jgi:CDP-diacylglycerol--glycerol-3-phosphate 3-phosphatidyltransferase
LAAVYQQNLSSLRRRWLAIAALYVCALLLGYLFLLEAWTPTYAAQWLLLALTTLCVQMGILWSSLRHNHRPSESDLLPFIGYGNAMTLTRGLLTSMLAGFLFAPLPPGLLAWAPALLYTGDRLIDYFDGYVARATGSETKLGAILDMEFDGLGILIAIVLGVQYGKLPIWYLLLGVSRQLFVAGIWLRQWRRLPVHDLPPSDHRRVIAGFQTGFMTVMLWPILTPQVTLAASYLMAIPLAFSFGRDWLVVSDRIDPQSPGYQLVRQRVKWIVEGWLPLAARLTGGVLAANILWNEAPTFENWTRYLSNAGLNALLTLLPGLIALWTLSIPLLWLGALGRLAALLLFGLACLQIMTAGWEWLDGGLLLVCTVIVVHLGSGRLALWQPEERLLRIRLGAPSKPTP